jgi:bifunctional non-homologous end joining protein LigD
MRDFAKTAEPRGAEKANGQSKAANGHSYVIQKHAARRLHYDFRLELDGVLLSWAVPKGPSLDPGVKRLAVETEPHPLEYGGFEGTIPQGQYGGGTVMVWDRGSWKPSGDARAAYQKGHLEFALQGEKLRGTWHLVRTARRDEEGRQWLLFKSRDEFANEDGDVLLTGEPDSALTGRSLEAIAAGEKSPKASARSSKQRESARQPTKQAKSGSVGTPERAKSPRAEAATETQAARKTKTTPTKTKTKANVKTKASSEPLPQAQEPELATLVDSAPTGEDWIHELKFDGYRVIARVEGQSVTLLTRNGKDWTDRMPSLAKAFAKWDLDAAMFDGELIALNEQGLSDFQTLQNSLSEGKDAELVYYAFDLLHHAGSDMRNRPLLERKQALEELFESLPKALTSKLRLSEHVTGRGADFFAGACQLGVEGIVSKRAASPYRPGRGRDWVKVKCLARQEFVVVGYTDPGGSRSHFGALLLGVHREGKLSYAGKVGTGFTAKSLRELHTKLAPLQQKKAGVEHPLRGADLAAVHWVKPKLIAEVAFTGFTDEGLLRHPTFQGLRDDKQPSEVVLEAAKPVAVAADDASDPDDDDQERDANDADEVSGVKSKTQVEAAELAAKYPLTNPKKVLYPELGMTKRELLDYYALVAERMLPHVGNRPLTLVRHPNGRDKPGFFQKHPAAKVPPGLRAITIRESEGKLPYSVIDDAEGLFGLLQLGALEIHTWGSRADDFEHPDLLVFDLDPDVGLGFGAVIDAAKRLRTLFQEAKLESFVKTTGGKGLHVCIPIAPEYEWDQIKDFTNRVADALTEEAPKKYVSTVSKAARRGKIFIDYLRNGRGATFIAPYSTRARENAPVAVPLEWDELTPSLKPDQFTVRNLAQRLKRLKADPFERMATLHQPLRPTAV